MTNSVDAPNPKRHNFRRLNDRIPAFLDTEFNARLPACLDARWPTLIRSAFDILVHTFRPYLLSFLVCPAKLGL